jgi:sugar/nucleoside kinase (ribokinase family)
MKAGRRKLFFDLADPEKRTNENILRALELVMAFQKHFDVIFGLNEKEGHEIARNLGMKINDSSPEALQKLCQEIHTRLQVDTLVIHPTSYALACSSDGSYMVEGPFTPQPKITTGAGDHFNSGFCLGKLLGFSTDQCLLTGVTTSGFYVRTAQSPSMTDLVGLLRNWPV